MAEQGGAPELAEQRAGKLLEGVRQDDDLEFRAQLLQKAERPVQRFQGADDLLDVR